MSAKRIAKAVVRQMRLKQARTVAGLFDIQV